MVEIDSRPVRKVGVAVRVSSCGGPRLVDGQEFRVDHQAVLPRTSYWEPRVDRSRPIRSRGDEKTVTDSIPVGTF